MLRLSWHNFAKGMSEKSIAQHWDVMKESYRSSPWGNATFGKKGTRHRDAPSTSAMKISSK